MHKIEIQTWRPIAADLVSEMRRFFIGGAPEISDISYVSHPDGSDVIIHSVLQYHLHAMYSMFRKTI